MSKKKPKPTFTIPSLRSDRDAVTELVKIGEADRRLQLAIAKLEAEVQGLTQLAELEISPLREEIDARIEVLRVYCDDNRKRLTNDGATKTHKFATGTVAWRHCPPSVKIRGKVEDMIEKIRAAGENFAKFLRPSVEINKQAMLDDQALAKSLGGVKITSSGEEFYVEPIGVKIDETVLT